MKIFSTRGLNRKSENVNRGIRFHLIRWNSGGADACGSHEWGPTLFHVGGLVNGQRPTSGAERGAGPTGRGRGCRRLPRFLSLARAARGQGRRRRPCSQLRPPTTMPYIPLDSGDGGGPVYGWCGRRRGRRRAGHHPRRTAASGFDGVGATVRPATNGVDVEDLRGLGGALVVIEGGEGLGLELI